MARPRRLPVDLRHGPVLVDAAMGTRLIERGLQCDHDDPSLWNLTHPEVVRDLHRRDIEAGSELLLTNTFGANRAWLDRFGLGDQVVAINRAAVAHARWAAGPDRLLLGSIGPAATESPADFRAQAASLAQAGIDIVVLETHSAGRLVDGSLRDCLARADQPVVVCLHDWPLGEQAEEIALKLLGWGASGLGFNCHSDLAAMLSWARAIRQRIDAPLLLQPSAGPPRGPLHPPESFAAMVPALNSLGGVLIGGCCGCTEAHIAALRAAIDS